MGVGEPSEVQRANGLGEPIIDPVHRVADFTRVDPSVKHASLLPPTNRTVLAGENIYQVIRHRFPDMVLSAGVPVIQPKSYQVSGDHLHVAVLDTSRPVYVRLGPDSNPWIRVRRGMTLRRNFSKFTIVDTEHFFVGQPPQDPSTTNTPGFATLYASVGPLIEDIGLEDGVLRELVTEELTATVAGVPLASFYTVQRHLMTAGQVGAEVMITNLDLANTVYFGAPGVGSGTAGVPIFPGASFSFKLRGRLSSENSTLFVVAGTARVNVTFSPVEWDRYDMVNPGSGQVP